MAESVIQPGRQGPGRKGESAIQHCAIGNFGTHWAGQTLTVIGQPRPSSTACRRLRQRLRRQRRALRPQHAPLHTCRIDLVTAVTAARRSAQYRQPFRRTRARGRARCPSSTRGPRDPLARTRPAAHICWRRRPVPHASRATRDPAAASRRAIAATGRVRSPRPARSPPPRRPGADADPAGRGVGPRPPPAGLAADTFDNRPQHVDRRSNLALSRHHRRQPFGQVPQHLEGRRSRADDDSGAQNHRGHARPRQNPAHLGPRAQVRGCLHLLWHRSAQVDDSPNTSRSSRGRKVRRRPAICVLKGR